MKINLCAVLNNAALFAQQHVDILEKDLRIIIHCTKSSLYNGTNTWKKKHRKLLWRHHGQFWWCQNLRVFWHPYKTLADLRVFFQKIYHDDLIYILRSGARSSFCTSYTCLVFLMTPGNVFLSSWQGSYGTFQVPTWIKNDLSHFEYFRKIYLYIDSISSKS